MPINSTLAPCRYRQRTRSDRTVPLLRLRSARLPGKSRAVAGAALVHRARIRAQRARQDQHRTTLLPQQPPSACPTHRDAIRGHWAVENRLHRRLDGLLPTIRYAHGPLMRRTTSRRSNISPQISSVSIRSSVKVESKPVPSSPLPPIPTVPTCWVFYKIHAIAVTQLLCPSAMQ